MATKKKALVTDLYVPQDRYQTLWFVREDTPEGTPELQVEVRADLTIAELESLQWPKDTTDEEAFELLAPFVVGWNVGIVKDGVAVPADPPSVAGGEAFKLINPLYAYKIAQELKFRSSGAVKVDFLPPSKRTAPSNGDTNSSDETATPEP